MTMNSQANGLRASQAGQPLQDQLPAIRGPRLPYHPAIQERFGIDKSGWKAIVEAIFPNAQSVDSVILALSYCKARKLDPFKRCVNIVPVYSKERRCYVDTIWPGIAELRTTAFRTGEYGGRNETVFGETVTRTVGNVEVTFPEWAQVTVSRFVHGQNVPFVGPRVYWLESYANRGRDDDTPNQMWQERPFGQLDKCAEAAALRCAFPEEIGNEYIPEEVQHDRTHAVTAPPRTDKRPSLDRLTDQLSSASAADSPADLDDTFSQSTGFDDPTLLSSDDAGLDDADETTM